VIFTARELAQIRHLELLAAKTLRGQLIGLREVRRGGPGSGFREHRAYSEGDSLRRVDWNVYARMDALVVKEFEAEEALDLVIVQDRTSSMHGAAATCAAKVAGALGAVALSHLDRVVLLPVGGDRPAETFTGRARTLDLLEAVSSEVKGETDLLGAVRSRLPRGPRSGVAFVVGDFFDAAGATRVLSFLLSRRFHVRAVQVEDPEALAPPPPGPVRLVDAETGRTLRLDVTRDSIAAYKRTLQARAAGLRAFCRRTGTGYLRVRAFTPFFEIVRAAVARGWLVP